MKKLLCVVCVCWMIFIFYNSSNNGKVSHSKSYAVMNVLGKVKSIVSVEKVKDITGIDVNKSDLNFIIRKSAHCFEYFVLAIIVSMVLFACGFKGKNTIVYILFICLLYAVSDEFHQEFVPQRTSSVGDILIDFGGSVFGTTIYYLVYYKIYKGKKRSRH